MFVKDFSMSIVRQMNEGDKALFNMKNENTADQIARAVRRVDGKVKINRMLLTDTSLNSQKILMVTLITKPRPNIPHNKKVQDNEDN